MMPCIMGSFGATCFVMCVIKLCVLFVSCMCCRCVIVIFVLTVCVRACLCVCGVCLGVLSGSSSLSGGLFAAGARSLRIPVRHSWP